jgi:hypothetical protein
MNIALVKWTTRDRSVVCTGVSLDPVGKLDACIFELLNRKQFYYSSNGKGIVFPQIKNKVVLESNFQKKIC